MRIASATKSIHGSGLGLEAQRAAIAAAAEHRGWDVEWISDNGSGKNMKRAGMERARAMLNSGEVATAS